MLLAPDLDQKAVTHDGPRLLPRLILRALVDDWRRRQEPADRPKPDAPLCSRRAKSSTLAFLAQWPRFPKRARLLALRPGAPALLLPKVGELKPAQPPYPRPGARTASAPERTGRYARRALGSLPCDGHNPRPGDREGEGPPWGLFCGQASFGRCRSKTEWVYGFKVALVVSPEGVVTAFFLAPAACDERPIGEILIAKDRYGSYLADKGFFSLAWERHWLECYGALVATPKENSRRAWPEVDRRWAAGKRQVIEGVIGQLKELFGLERHRAKTPGVLLRR
jgi:hypothetical protein